jgi:hypothetical protein
MNLSKNDLEAHMNCKIKLLEKKSLLKETNMINVNQLRIKRDLLSKINLNNNKKIKYKFQKDITKKTVIREIIFKHDKSI